MRHQENKKFQCDLDINLLNHSYYKIASDFLDYFASIKICQENFPWGQFVVDCKELWVARRENISFFL